LAILFRLRIEYNQKCSLYATFGAVPSRPSGFDLVLIIVLFAVKLFSSFAAFASSAVGLLFSLAGLASLAVRLFLVARRREEGQNRA
jgi:hypothetical protein